MRHSNILFKRNPLVTQTEETVDSYHVLRQLRSKFVLFVCLFFFFATMVEDQEFIRLSVFLNCLSPGGTYMGSIGMCSDSS